MPLGLHAAGAEPQIFCSFVLLAVCRCCITNLSKNEKNDRTLVGHIAVIHPRRIRKGALQFLVLQVAGYPSGVRGELYCPLCSTVCSDGTQ